MIIIIITIITIIISGTYLLYGTTAIEELLPPSNEGFLI